MISDPTYIADTSASAAIYVRVSTDKQNYSTAHQTADLTAFALSLDLTIVKRYTDEGKSGLDIKGRAALRELLSDVQSGRATYGTILIYDVSRWGRFQDVDESAYYEYLCRAAGIIVLYSAEQFKNDGSPISSLIKAIKRTMAAEYSRELSNKVFSAQCRFISMGYKQGGSAGYGLRRLSVSVDGQPRRVLQPGERKGSPTDRVIYTLGPANEIEILCRIYRMYLDNGLGDTAISKALNDQGVPSEFGRRWTPWLVRSVLTNEKYTGTISFNRGSFKLKRKLVANPKEMWVRYDGAFVSPLPAGSFDRARAERKRRLSSPTDEELLARLRNLHQLHGKVTTSLLTEHVNSTMPKLLANRFGTITNAYCRAGIPTSSNCSYVAARRFIAKTRENTLREVRMLALAGGASVSSGGERNEFIFNDWLRVRAVMVRCRGGKQGFARWKIPENMLSNVDFAIGVRMSRKNDEVAAYYLLSRSQIETGTITFKEELPEYLADCRFDTLAQMFGVSGIAGGTNE